MAHHFESKQWADASKILERGVNLGIIENSFSPIESQETLKTIEEKFKGLRVRINTSLDWKDSLIKKIKSAGWPELPSYQQFFCDLVENFSKLTETTELGFRFEPVSSNICVFLHVDHVRLRAIATLAGETTFWLPNEYANRDGLMCQNDNLVMKKNAKVSQLPKGSVGLFKGSAWPANHDNAIIHKSPPFIPGSAIRLLLTLDTL